MTWLVLAAALAAVLVIAVTVVLVVRLKRNRRIGSPEEVAEAAEHGLSGFHTANAVVGADGAGALAVAHDGRVAAARRRGAGIAVCEVDWHAIRSTAEGILVETGERRFGPVMLTGVNVLDIRRLAPAGEKRRLAS